MNSPVTDSLPELPAPRRLEVPRHDALVRRYARMESIGRLILGLEVIGALGMVAWWWSRGATVPGWPAWVALGIAGLGVFRFIPRSALLNKKRLEDIRPDARFGDHTRDSLVRLAGEVFARLGLPPGAAPVYLIRDKDVNAHAIRCELWPGQRVFNGVFLNRGLLHLLDERELACVIGHELGHVFPYSPLLSRTYLVHAAAAGMSSFCLVAALPYPALAVMVPLGLLWVLDWIVAFPHLRMARGMEFLCDEYGARAGGHLAAFSVEMKLAAENETRQELMLKVLEGRQRGVKVDLGELFEAYESAVPFGRVDPESFERDFGRLIARKRRDERGVSLGGFLKSLSGGDGDEVDESLKEGTERLRLILALPVLGIDRSRYLRGSGWWTPAMSAALVAAIRADPRRVLFRLPDELDDRASSHPCASRRLLFLHDQETPALTG